MAWTWRGEAVAVPRDPLLTPSQNTVLRALVHAGATTRPDLSTSTNFSAPTVIHVISELQEAGLVDLVDTRQGSRGRAAQVYSLGKRSGWCLGVDYGTSHIELVALNLAGELIAHGRIENGSSGERFSQPSADITSRIRDFRLATSRRFGALRAAGIAVPTIVPPEERFFTAGSRTETPARADDVGPSFELSAVVAACDLPMRLTVVLENNINCSALGESRRVSQPTRDVVYLQLGQGGVGIGIVTDGRLLRGTTGAAGEMRWFPFPFYERADKSAFDMEDFFGSVGLLARAQKRFEADDAPESIHALMARARSHDPIAAGIVDEYAGHVALALMAFISVLDPELIVLGGGLGNTDVLVSAVKKRLRDYGRPIPVAGDSGETGTAWGAALLGVDQAWAELGT